MRAEYISLALGRFKAFSEGKELWRLLQEQISEILYRSDLGDSSSNTTVTRDRLVVNMPFTNGAPGSNARPLYELVRLATGVYDLDASKTTSQDQEADAVIAP